MNPNDLCESCKNRNVNHCKTWDCSCGDDVSDCDEYQERLIPQFIIDKYDINETENFFNIGLSTDINVNIYKSVKYYIRETDHVFELSTDHVSYTFWKNVKLLNILNFK